MPALPLSPSSKRIAGLLLLTIIGIEFGGYFLIGAVSGAEPLTDFQLGFSRAGHAHAGVLVILSLVCLLFADAAGLPSKLSYLTRLAIPAAAVLMSAGFFLSAAGEGRTEPNDLIVILYAGAASLTIGVISLAIALFRSASRDAATRTAIDQPA